LQSLHKFIFGLFFDDVTIWLIECKFLPKFLIRGANLSFSELKLTRYVNKNWYIDTSVSSRQNETKMTLI